MPVVTEQSPPQRGGGCWTRRPGGLSSVRKSAANVPAREGHLSHDMNDDDGHRARVLRRQLTGPDGSRSLSAALRRRRARAMLEAFPDLAEMRVVDVGGRPATWEAAEVRPSSVVCVNIEDAPPDRGGWLRCVAGDVCDLGFVESLGSFDLVYSNSTIEHVGGHARRVVFAEAVRKLAPRYWVQTPNRYFPVEPHAVFPAFQFLPVSARRAIAQRWPLSPLGTDGDLLDEILSIELLSATELRWYFPEARIWKERVAGMTKSLVAVL